MNRMRTSTCIPLLLLSLYVTVGSGFLVLQWGLGGQQQRAIIPTKQQQPPRRSSSEPLSLPPIVRASSSSTGSSSDTNGAESSSDPVEELSEERKANLFQFLLRDLQVEGVPLLGVDADQVHTLQAALWTTMAELSEQDDEEKACLIFESIPVTALRSFVDDFMILKTQQRLMKFLPELERFSLSLVGKGVGPAVLIEVAKKDTPATMTSRSSTSTDEHRISAAMKMFIDRMVAGRQISGYPSSKDATSADDGSSNKQIPPPMMYRTCNIAETCHILSSFWNNICELLASPPGASVMLSLPSIDSAGRFGAISELLSRSLCLYRGDDIFELLHFFPEYHRNQIHPVDKPAHGHLPPLNWLRPMLRRHNGKDEQADQLSDQDLVLLNYQRRSPVASVCIVPVELFEANLSPADGIVNLDIGDGSIVQASGVESYAKSLIELSSQGEDQLKASLETEWETASG